MTTPTAQTAPDAATLSAARDKAYSYLLGLQKPGGDWEGEMVWCTMILAQAVIVRTIVGKPYDEAEQRQIIRHFEITQAADGAWGMHPESPGYVFFTTLAYVALRLLGLPPDTPMLRQARTWFRSQSGGVEGIPTWGKFWLAIIGLYDYRGLNAIPPELFLLPKWLPFHPSRFYCHTRLIYLAIAFIGGNRFVASLPANVRDDLRRELYDKPYGEIDFTVLRHRLAPSDVYVPITPLLRRIYDLLAIFERWHGGRLRQKALKVCFERILYEQRTTRYQGISPVNGLLNTLAIFINDPHHPDLAPSLEGVEAWRWEDKAEGLRYVGARSNTWDTGFVLQALTELPEPSPIIVAAAARAQNFLDGAQMVEELPGSDWGWRDPALGGWCFSDGEHRWPVSDCTAEALTGLLTVYEHPAFTALPRLSDTRLRQAAEVILSRQNTDGGFGTYERRRAGKLLELINPSEMFGQCMTELSYIECTASSVAALCHYRKHYPDLADGQIDRAIAEAIKLLRSKQLADGSYQGFWGINYTYAIFHVTKALRMAGIPAEDPALTRAAMWLKTKQRADGGWGEHYTSCLEDRYIEHQDSQAVMTSWALLTLLDLVPASDTAIVRGIQWLLRNQETGGGWRRQSVNGVFFGAAMLDYRLYHTYFPVWALARYTYRNIEA
jgi:lanosterol synthase